MPTGSLGAGNTLSFLAATLLPSEESGPGSLQVDRCLNLVSVCGYDYLFCPGLSFLVPTVGAFPESPRSFSSCLIQELDTEDSHGNGRQQMEEGS